MSRFRIYKDRGQWYLYAGGPHWLFYSHPTWREAMDDLCRYLEANRGNHATL